MRADHQAAIHRRQAAKAAKGEAERGPEPRQAGFIASRITNHQ
jgi:hypothetical protein